ncbi:hypothetical protein K458DRAFT_82314 [Lentithecium fluviatile CBS 122367]|uniref:Uncharacterized protein n=1 Tax=Lentithecium fluviatile CBS 122367 TaxID=1168545 RepID=A0A6G1ISX0_9PLEO|nr:hypothetical protein K458DRAFT_82314 [Lentithecium fluviatile CBS 122367]
MSGSQCRLGRCYLQAAVTPSGSRLASAVPTLKLGQHARWPYSTISKVLTPSSFEAGKPVLDG